MPSSNPNSINARKVDSEVAAERRQNREETLDAALASKPGSDGFRDGDELFDQIVDGPTG